MSFMRWLKFAIACYLVIVFQTGFLSVLFPNDIRPFLPIILANIVALSWPVEYALLGVWLIGLSVDLTSIVPPGVSAFCFGVYCLFVLAIRPVLFLESPFAYAVTASLGVIIFYLCYGLIGLISNVVILPVGFTGILGQCISTGLVAGAIGQAIYKRFASKNRRMISM